MAIPKIPEHVTEQLDTIIDVWSSAPQLRAATQHRSAVNALSALQAMRREIEEFFRELKKTVNAHRRNLLDRERAMLANAKPVEAHLAALIVAWDAEQDAAAREHALSTLEGRTATSLDAPGEWSRDGYYTRLTLVPEVTDKAALVAAVAAGLVSLDAIDVNLPYFRKLAEEQGALIDVPGLAVTTKTTVITHA